MSEQSSEPSLLSLRSNIAAPLSSRNTSAEKQTNNMTQLAPSSTQKELPAAAGVFHRFHNHNLSDSTTGSYESSPTTTISTVDDSSATDPSPDSSPESPPPSTFAAGMLRPRIAEEAGAPFFELQKQPPPKKGRNLKNLAVNTSRPGARTSSTTSLPLNLAGSDSLGSVASPAFVKPPSPPKTKKRPSNLGLTLLTPGSGKAPPQEIKLAIPATPGLARPALRHFQSSPSLPLFPGLGRPAGIRPHGAHVPVSLETISSPVVGPRAEEEEQNFDIPLSREEKPEAYPDGPICVYQPYIDLYLEPTADQCREYDVVMNVASEVLNPLVEHAEKPVEESEIRIDGGGGIQYAPKRPQIAALKQETETIQTNSPTTPKATPLNNSFPSEAKSKTPLKDPEYVHIKWEHNSDIVPDLLRLCKLIDDRVTAGKRILIHCQCGVSRSASLVVAYGLYKNSSMSVQEAYDLVKQQSKWIGPNMNLIMQLQEFRTSLARGGLLTGNRGMSPMTPSSAYTEWRGPFSNNPSNDASRNIPMSAGVAPPAVKVTEAVTPGPSSAPSGLRWPLDASALPMPTQRPRAVSAAKPAVVEPAAAAYVDPSGHVVPVLKVLEPDSPGKKPQTEAPTSDSEEPDSATPTSESVSSPKTAEFAMTPLMPAKEVDPADSFGLMSPSTTEFSSSPFDRSMLLASLGMGSVKPQDDASGPRRSKSLRSPTEDPQSSGLQKPKHSLGLRKISSPNLREQKELQDLQAKIEASLPHRGVPSFQSDEALLSPRAEEFTKNPFALSLSIPSPDAPIEAAPPTSEVDPRSPAQAGATPITRNIMDVL